MNNGAFYRLFVKIYNLLFKFVSKSPVELLFSGGVTPQGAYNSGTTYATGDSVSYLGASYVAIQATTGNLPTDTTYWQILAEKGATGSTGDDGVVATVVGGTNITVNSTNPVNPIVNFVKSAYDYFNSGSDHFIKIYTDSGYKAGIKFAERESGAYGFVLYHDGTYNKLKLAYLNDSGDFSYTFLTIDRINDYFGFLTVNPTALIDVNSDIIRLRTPKTPASASASGNEGDICWDSNYIYVCTATDTWKRTAISTW